MATEGYRSTAFDAHGRKCGDCGDTTDLEVHHIDQDRTNNNAENLAVLCHDCHWDYHRDELSKRASGPQIERERETISLDSDDPSTDSMRDVDAKILKLLREGRVTTSYAANRVGYSLAYTRDRLNRLCDHGHAEKIHSGLYELTDDPREDSENE
jgi:hypothetical protein